MYKYLNDLHNAAECMLVANDQGTDNLENGLPHWFHLYTSDSGYFQRLVTDIRR